MAQIRYQRLTGARARGTFAVAFMSRSSLWLGDDHLLSVDSTGYSETYKRFYFRDIQAFFVQKTEHAKVINIVLTILLVLALAPALVAHSRVVLLLCLSLIGLLVLFLFVNLLQGQTCRCFLRTAVQTEPLPSLNRVRRAQKVSARFKPLIAEAQGGELSPETISERLREQVQSANASSAEGERSPNLPPRLGS